MTATGIEDERAGADLSCLASVLSLLLLGWIGWRFFNPTIGLIAALFYAVSPIELAIARRCWQDAPTELLVLILVWIACEITRGSRHTILFFLFGLLGATAVTIKESPVVMFVLVLAWILWELSIRREWKGIILVTGLSAAGLSVGVLWLSYNLGDFQTLLDFSRTASRFYETNSYSIIYEGGPSYLLLEALWILSPVVVLGSVAGFAMSFAGSRQWPLAKWAWRPAFCMTVIVLLFLSLAMFLHHKLNPRYIALTLGIWYLIAATGLWRALEWIRKQFPEIGKHVFATGAACLLLLAALSDYSTFQTRIVATGIQDLTARMIISPTGRISPAEEKEMAISYRETLANAHPTPERYLTLSLAFYQTNRFQDCIDASKEAIALRPDYAPAYTNICAANNMLGRFA